MESKLQHPELFRFSGNMAPGTFGFSQEWFPRKWQRTAGCGPTTAAFLYYYLTHADQQRGQQPSQEEALFLMTQMWSYMSPSLLGLFNPHRFIKGLTRFARDQGRPLASRSIFLRGKCRNQASVFQHIHTGLRADAPIAFLNLYSRQPAISAWHWTPIVALRTQGECGQATILDYGKKRTIPLDEWLATMPTLGAFIWFTQI